MSHSILASVNETVNTLNVPPGSAETVVSRGWVCLSFTVTGAKRAVPAAPTTPAPKKPRESIASPAPSTPTTAAGCTPATSSRDLVRASPAATSTSTAPSQLMVNASHLATVQQAWERINQHPVFVGISQEMPLPLGQSAIVPYNATDFAAAMNNPNGAHTCGGNAFWASPLFSSSPGVPINKNGVCGPASLPVVCLISPYHVSRHC